MKSAKTLLALAILSISYSAQAFPLDFPNKQIDENAVKISELTKNLEAVQSNISKQLETLESLNNELGHIKNENLDALSSELAKVNSSTLELKKSLTTNDEGLKKLSGDLETRKDAIDDRLDTHGAKIKNMLSNKLNKDEFEGYSKDINDKLDKEIQDRKDHSGIFKKRLDKQAKAITNLNAQLEKTPQFQMATLNQRINQMDKKLERGLASSAALAGLVQPHGVNKINVTMALGMYRSSQALAAGVGYRANEHWTIRGGVATNTQNFQDFSANIGTGFEF